MKADVTTRIALRVATIAGRVQKRVDAKVPLGPGVIEHTPEEQTLIEAGALTSQDILDQVRKTMSSGD